MHARFRGHGTGGDHHPRRPQDGSPSARRSVTLMHRQRREGDRAGRAAAGRARSATSRSSTSARRRRATRTPAAPSSNAGTRSLTYATGDQLVPRADRAVPRPGGELADASTAPEALVIVRACSIAPARTPRSRRARHQGTGRGAARLPAAALASGRGWRCSPSRWPGLYRLLSRRRPRCRRRSPLPAARGRAEALGKLHAAHGWSRHGRHEEFYVRLSDIVRTYLEARFHLRAPEMTTEEFLAGGAARRRQLSAAAAHRRSARSSEADLVKFARYVPAAD